MFPFDSRNTIRKSRNSLVFLLSFPGASPVTLFLCCHDDGRGLLPRGPGCRTYLGLQAAVKPSIVPWAPLPWFPSVLARITFLGSSNVQKCSPLSVTFACQASREKKKPSKTL